MNINDFISVDHLLADILSTVDDEKLRRGFSKGWYVSRIQKAIQELAIDTFFDEVTLDLDLDGETLTAQMPEGIFNIRELHLYNDDCCNASTSQVVHWKRTFNNKGRGDGYTARIKDTGHTDYSDPFLPSVSNYNNTHWYSGTKFYANIMNGTMMFSTDCRLYGKVRIVANGLGGDIGDVPLVPRFFEEAVTDFVYVRFYKAMKAREPRKYRPLWQDAKTDSVGPNGNGGSWRKARIRIANMDTYEKEALEEYLSSMYHK
ncbi:MAG: hypothetical protein ACXAB7_09945 [Candidatus Kariarchaeaceae archaeon]|jgi:hypothetical protein